MCLHVLVLTEAQLEDVAQGNLASATSPSVQENVQAGPSTYLQALALWTHYMSFFWHQCSHELQSSDIRDIRMRPRQMFVHPLNERTTGLELEEQEQPTHLAR